MFFLFLNIQNSTDDSFKHLLSLQDKQNLKLIKLKFFKIILLI